MTKADHILTLPKIAAYTESIKQTSRVGAAIYHQFYEPLMASFIQYVELLPDSTHRYYKDRGGLLTYALHRTDQALSLLKPHLLCEQTQVLSEAQQCWQYALFSASLLYGIGKLYLDYQIDLYDPSGQFLETFNPFKRSLLAYTAHYHCKVEGVSTHEFRCHVNIALAKTIMPSEGFEWLTQSPAVFEAWLALLHEDLQGARALGAILNYAESLVSAKFINELLAKLGAPKATAFRTFDHASHDMMLQAGLAFLAWLRTQLETGDMCLNQSPLSLTDQGLTIGQEAFKAFTKTQSSYKNWEAVARGFASLAFNDAHIDTAEVLLTQFGIVLPAQARFRDPASGKYAWRSAQAVVNFVNNGAKTSAKDGVEKAFAMLVLNEKGVWQSPSMAKQLLQSSTHRG